jgi:hypothetical protein
MNGTRALIGIARLLHLKFETWAQILNIQTLALPISTLKSFSKVLTMSTWMSITKVSDAVKMDSGHF